MAEVARGALLLMGDAPEGFDAELVRREVEARGPVLHVARDEARAAAFRAALGFFAPALPVLSFPAWDCLPYDRVSPAPEVGARRMATLAALGAGMRGGFVVSTTVNAALQRVPTPQVVAGAAMSLAVGQRVDEAGLRQWLARMGYVPAAAVAEPGDFAQRGGILDLFPPGRAEAVRLDFFGDQLDGIRTFDPATQRTTGKLERLDLAPASEVILDPEAIARFRSAYRAEFGAVADDPLYEAVSAGRKHQGMEHWLPWFHAGLATIFDHLPGASVVLDERIEGAHSARWETIADQYENRRAAMAARGRLDTPYRPAPPGLLYLDAATWEGVLAPLRRLQMSPLAQPPGPGVLDAGGRAGRRFTAERQDEKANVFSALADHVRTLRLERTVVLAAWSEGARERLAGLLADHGLSDATPVADARGLGPAGRVHLAVWPLDEGFTAPGLAVISEQDVLGERLVRPARRRKAENVLSDAQSIGAGDLVVHADHGVGRYLGLETVTALGAPHECLTLEYAGGDKLYLPVENIELLSRYGHEEGLLDKLGGGAWQARKARLKQRIRDIADKLLRVAAERELRRAPVLEPPEGMWAAFAARFPYAETDDQLRAIDDVLGDLDRGRPMDRLIVGDVGFGKTEVAMRAAFVAAMSGLQVAVICPTTLLSRQHFLSFSERLRGFPLVVRQLSRFVSAREAAQTREDLAEGRVDVVVGTHALLAKGVKFRNLGLLIIDEEQHFGVGHKERLKELRSDIHVLTLTATPIPRTLQMALNGVRDLSVIATPPVDRLAIRTYVSEFDTVTIREALLRERARGGQAFVVVPRIADLAEVGEVLTEAVPELRILVAHGQMAAGELDAKMNAFYDGQYDVLLSTTIVESGLDIPRANTMIVLRADLFGLSQLYQIRGRVGRSKIRAFCYLMTEPRKALTPQAERRLKLLGSIDSLGAGLNVASADMDLRGAGNILGEEQSGQIREVGFELYQQMLEETLAKLRSGDLATIDEGEWAPQINLGVPVLIPEGYVPDLDIRLSLYRRLSTLETKVEFEGFAAELIDRFGPLPREVNTLLIVVRVKAMCKRARIARLDAGPRGATIQFHQDRFPNPAGLVEFLTAQAGHAKLRDNRLVVARDWGAEGERLKGAFAIARELAERAAGKAPTAPSAPPPAPPPVPAAKAPPRPIVPRAGVPPLQRAPLRPPAPPPRRR
jgi:transcription-repair coupling factor (superfamily II helicase)